MANLVAVVDTPSIKRYVFGTDSLIEIRGASALLDTLNRIDTEQLLSASKVYANGGSGQFLFTGVDEDEAEGRLLGLTRHYHEQTRGGATLAYGLAPLTDDYGQSLAHAFDNLRAKRETSPVQSMTMTFPLLKECDSCSERPAAVHYLRPDVSWLCEVCAGKRDAAYDARHTGLWQEMEQYLTRGKLDRPQSFNEVGDYLAVVYADGNGIGRWIQGIGSSGHFATFASAVDRSIREACFATLGQLFPSNPVQADVLLLGGDDLVVVIEAGQALVFAYELARRFEEATRRRLRGLTSPGGAGLSLSVGVAIGKAHHPFRSLLDTAEQLLRSAKRAGASQAAGRNMPSMVDFHLTSMTNTLELEQLRQDEYELVDAEGIPYRRTRRPYTLQDLERLFAVASGLKRATFPRTRLNSLYEAVFEPTPARACLRTIEIFTRGRDRIRETLAQALHDAGCLQHMPWSAEARDTIISELVECYDYLPRDWSLGTEGR